MAQARVEEGKGTAEPRVRARWGAPAAFVLLSCSLGMSWAAGAQTRLNPKGSTADVLWLQDMQCGFEVRAASGLSNLIRMADLSIELSEAQECRIEADRRRMLQARPLADMPFEQLKRYFADPPDCITSKERQGLKEIRRWAAAALQRPEGPEREACLARIFELGAAINNDHRSVVPDRLGASDLPKLLRHYLHNPVARGASPAADIAAAPHRDLSRADPAPSEFWAPPGEIRELDLYVAYGRSALPNFADLLWTYHAPKTGGGISPGFQAEHGKTRIKIKFHEITSEPFTARMFWAMGYHADPVDYVPYLKLRYNRRFLREMHLRHEAPVPVKLFGMTVYRFHYQPRFDPFQFIREAVLKDGCHIPGPELRRRIYKRPALEHPEDDPGNFRPEVEEQIDYFITSPASVQVRDPHLKSIGPWDFQELGHEDLRPLRAAGLLAAWLNWCDSRFHNTRLRLIKNSGPLRYQYYFCDLGGGMGQGTGFFFRRFESPNDLDWTFTSPERRQGKGKMTVPFRIVGYKPIGDTPAFKKMTVDDARWMARKIGELTEDQLLAALIASGFDSAQAKIYLEKLISRRDQMIRDLGLTPEIALLRPDGPSKDCFYDPQQDGPLQVRTRSGQIAQSQQADWIVVDGRVIRNPAAPGNSEPKTPVHKPQVLSVSQGN